MELLHSRSNLRNQDVTHGDKIHGRDAAHGSGNESTSHLLPVDDVGLKVATKVTDLRAGFSSWAWAFALLLVSAMPVSASQVSLAWNDNSTNETAFKIERALSNLAFVQVGTVGANVSTYVDTTVSPATAYWYRVRASNASGDSSYSNVITVTSPSVQGTAPVISNIADMTISAGSSTGALAFTVSDAQTAAGSLVVSGASSNTTLISNAAIVFGGSGSNRTITVTPAAGQAGTATITVTVSDGGMSASDTFVVTVNAASGTAPQTLAFSNVVPIVIPDQSSNASVYPSPINVTGMSGSITTVTARLDGFSQSWTNDMDVLLVSPTGQKLLLMSDVGTGVTSNATFTFTDSASAYLPESGALSTGTYKPTNYDTTTDTFSSPAPAGPYASSFAVFQGQNPNGSWSLYVRDAGPGQGRRFDGGWTLTISTSGGSAGAPTISDIANQSIAINTSTAALPFTVSDVDTASTSLIVSGSSSNPALIPSSGVVFGGSGSNRTVTVTPAAGQSGTATITVTVSDGVRSTSDTFVVTVSAVNTAPTISPIANGTIALGGNLGPLGFTVGDAETAAGLLTVSRASSSTVLVPVANIVLGGSNANRTVTVSPAAGQTGTATITLTVSDGALSRSTTFTVSVVAANSSPVISNIADMTISAGSSTGALAFTVSDAQTAAGSLVVSGASSNTTLISNAAIVFGGSGSNRTITVTPAAGQAGTATITVTVSDGGMSASDTFVVTVNAASGTAPQTLAFSNVVPIVIPDQSSNASVYPSPINVTGMSGSITTVTARLDGFSQSWTNDMDVLLVSPTGQKLLLMSDVGTGVTSNASFTFADSASAYLPESGGLSTGTYKPTNYDTTTDTFSSPAPAGPYAGSFAVFQGQNPNGTWSLYVRDAGPGQGRRFDGGWTLTITTSGGSAGAPTMPPPWLTADIGTTTAKGSAVYSDGVYTLKGAGTLGGSVDSNYFLYQTLSGDGEIKARVLSEQNTGAAARAGVMIRESLNSNSRFAAMTIDSSGAYRFLRRTSTGGNTASTSSSSGTFPNTWIRLVRSGNTITAYRSLDGATWTTVREQVVSMANTIYIGLAVASGDSAALNTTIVDNVVVVP